jgi:O-antigen/teichoic acid export membrane protein
VVPFIALSFIFRGIQYVLSLSLHYVKQTRYNAYIVMGMALFNIGLNFLLQPLLGVYGAALSGVLSYFVMLNIFRYYSRKFFDPGYETGKISLMIVLGIILYLISLLFQDLALGWVILLKLILVLAFPFILYPFGFYESIELERIRGAVRKWRHPGHWFSNTRDFFQK